jgi:predicted tellurium resistance membrane protein TerC/creatinine amidohydrolase/Fe(II)-dependent formamide hydrolase-like protein
VQWLTSPEAWAALLSLTALEIVLGVDNIIFISILVARLPVAQRHRARLIGLALAMVMRIGLLLSLAWMMRLTDPLFTIGKEISGRDLILIGGGLFLLAKSVMEIHSSLEGAGDEHLKGGGAPGFYSTLAQIMVVDIVFSLDSVITAVGMVSDVPVMILAIVIAVGIMMFAAKPIGRFRRRASDDQDARARIPDSGRRRVGGRRHRSAYPEGLHLFRDGVRVRRRDAQPAHQKGAPADSSAQGDVGYERRRRKDKALNGGAPRRSRVDPTKPKRPDSRVMHSLAVLIVACLLSFEASSAPSSAPATVFIDDLTWTELRAEIAAGKTTLLVPIGGTEQNGPHMTLGKHNARASALAQKIAHALGNALVAPTIAYVPGGRAESADVAHALSGNDHDPGGGVRERRSSTRREASSSTGFATSCCSPIMAATAGVLKTVADRLDREWASTPVRVHALDEYYAAADTLFAQALRRQGYRDEEIGTHAGLADTSLAMAIDPRLVRTDRLRSADPLGRADGVYGDPRRATPELGQAGVDLIVANSVAAIRRAVARK